MSETDWTIQVSPKLPDGSLINIRGNAVSEVMEKLGQLAEQAGDLTDSMRLIAAAGTAVNAGHAAAQAAPAAPAPANWTPPQGQATAAPAASQPGAAPSCQHGPRQFKVTNNGKKLWECVVAGANWKDPNACKAVWVNDR